MTMKKVMTTIFLMTLLFTAGCATAINGRYQAVKITSDPPGAKISFGFTGKLNLITPGEMNLVRNVPVTLVAQKEGYHSARQEIKPQLNNWIFGNAFLMGPGIITSAFDYAFGAGFELTPKEVHFELIQKEKELAIIAPSPRP